MDIVDRIKRSQMMSRIGPRDTRPEIAVRRVAHRLGFRFRLHRKDLPGRPDIVPRSTGPLFLFTAVSGIAILGCSNCTAPKTRAEFWREKFARNVARDERNMRDLATLGWLPMVIWECETEDELAVQRRLLQIRRKARRRGSPRCREAQRHRRQQPDSRLAANRKNALQRALTQILVGFKANRSDSHLSNSVSSVYVRI